MLAAMWRWTPLAEWVTPSAVIEWAETFAGYWWAPFVLMLAYTPANMFLFPRPLLTLAAVVVFGPLPGFAYAMSGILLSAALIHLLGRVLPERHVMRIAGPRIERVAKAMRRHGVLAMTGLTVLPVAPFVVDALMSGAIRVRLWQFLVAVAIGMTPGVAAMAFFGGELRRALRDPSQIDWFVVALVALAFGALWFGMRRWFARLEQRGELSPQRDPATP